MSGEELSKKLETELDKLIAKRIAEQGNQSIFRHVVEKNHDDWKYSYESSIGPADNRHSVKTRGDVQAEVLKEHKEAIEALDAKPKEKKEE